MSIRETAKATAKNVRATLKNAFPNVKFSVRSKCFVSVKWSDGPDFHEVERVLDTLRADRTNARIFSEQAA